MFFLEMITGKQEVIIVRYYEMHWNKVMFLVQHHLIGSYHMMMKSFAVDMYFSTKKYHLDVKNSPPFCRCVAGSVDGPDPTRTGAGSSPSQ
jgi:hypothetical protein